MSKYTFKPEQRFAIWLTYKKKCFYCGEPIDYRELTIDHVLPELLLGKLEKLEEIKQNFGLGDDFSINNYCNWVSSHFHCNREKGTTIYDASPAMIKTLVIVGKNAEKARKEELKIIRMLNNGKLFAKYEIALQNGMASRDDWISKIELDFDTEIARFNRDDFEDMNEAMRMNDAIAYLRAKRKYDRNIKLAEDEKLLALAYIDSVLLESAD